MISCSGSAAVRSSSPGGCSTVCVSDVSVNRKENIKFKRRLHKMFTSEWRRVVRPSSLAVLLGLLLTSGCGVTTVSGDAGCPSYAEARLAMPKESVPRGAWGEWIADTDDRMTDTCNP